MPRRLLLKISKCLTNLKMLTVMRLLSVVVALSCVGAGEGGGVSDTLSYFLQTMPGVIERKSLTFFSHFGANLNRNRKEGRLECDYDDPAKRSMCPPIVSNPFPPSMMKKSGADEKAMLANLKQLITKCLENPDDPDCRQLDTDASTRGLQASGTPTPAPVNAATGVPTMTPAAANVPTAITSTNTAPTPAPSSFLSTTDYPAGFVATEMPTKVHNARCVYKRCGIRE
jgi:hypothetical protein